MFKQGSRKFLRNIIKIRSYQNLLKLSKWSNIFVSVLGLWIAFEILETGRITLII